MKAAALQGCSYWQMKSLTQAGEKTLARIYGQQHITWLNNSATRPLQSPQSSTQSFCHSDQLPQHLVDMIQAEDLAVTDYTLQIGYDQLSAEDIIRVTNCPFISHWQAITCSLQHQTHFLTQQSCFWCRKLFLRMCVRYHMPLRA